MALLMRDSGSTVTELRESTDVIVRVRFEWIPSTMSLLEVWV